LNQYIVFWFDPINHDYSKGKTGKNRDTWKYLINDGLDVKALKDVEQLEKLIEKWFKEFDLSKNNSPFEKTYIFISSDAYMPILLDFLNKEGQN